VGAQVIIGLTQNFYYRSGFNASTSAIRARFSENLVTSLFHATAHKDFEAFGPIIGLRAQEKKTLKFE
jgi:hypothetical protein